MSQNWNNYKIILELLKSDSHLREIARNTKISPSTLLRNLNYLLDENVIDYVEEGKNFKYFLKNSLEAQNYIFISEMYKFNEFVKFNSSLREIIIQIKKIAKNNLVIIFGSFADFSQNKNSDLDLYIETNDKNLKLEIEKLDSRLSVKIGKFDIISILGKEILKKHIILQNIERFYFLIENEKN